MRQAGRYLPEYRDIRKKTGDFLSLCKNYELASEVTIQPLRRFDLDAAILFTDILTIPDAMGLGLYFVKDEGPKFKTTISTSKQIDKLFIPDMADLSYVFDTITLTKKNLQDKPLIGFAGSPWTLATYMIEGGSSKNFTKIKAMMYKEPNSIHKLLDKLSDAIIKYLNAQIASGVDAVMIFDTWGGVLTKECYLEFSLQYMRKITLAINRTTSSKYVPITLFTKGGGAFLEQIADTTCDAIGLDWTVELSDAKKRVGKKVALQGNLDPCVLYAGADKIVTETKKILKQFGPGSGYVFNLGHGIYPDVNYEHIKTLINTVHDFGKK